MGASAFALIVLWALGCAHSATAGPMLGNAPKTCFWSDVVDPPHKNIVLPDANATYWYSRFTLPAGGRVVLHGTFPHARSFFLWNYQLLTPHDGLHDAQITPATAQHAQGVQLIYRVYLPDAGRGRTGGAGLPAARYVPAGGPPHAGQAACDALHNDAAQTPTPDHCSRRTTRPTWR